MEEAMYCVEVAVCVGRAGRRCSQLQFERMIVVELDVSDSCQPSGTSFSS